jgi:hypothetical protein
MQGDIRKGYGETTPEVIVEIIQHHPEALRLALICTWFYEILRDEMGESKNTFKKIGPSLLLSRNMQRNTNQYDNNNQHIEYNHFIETAHFLQSCIEGIFGLTHIHGITHGKK